MQEFSKPVVVIVSVVIIWWKFNVFLTIVNGVKVRNVKTHSMLVQITSELLHLHATLKQLIINPPWFLRMNKVIYKRLLTICLIKGRGSMATPIPPACWPLPFANDPSSSISREISASGLPACLWYPHLIILTIKDYTSHFGSSEISSYSHISKYLFCNVTYFL